VFVAGFGEVTCWLEEGEFVITLQQLCRVIVGALCFGYSSISWVSRLWSYSYWQ